MSKSICTIIAKNYISFARTLCSSFIDHHPGGKCYVLIIDEFEGYIDATKENFEIIRFEELGIPRLKEFCFKYNITELATAAKPYLLKHLFDTEGMDRLLYLDPDILVMHSLGKLYEALEKSDIVVTPHLDKDYPDDGLMPNDSHIMRSGIYNLGFIGVRNCEDANKFLVWWQHKLYDRCVVDPCAGYFVDQKFIDFAMVLFRDIAVIYDTGYNVAYWNIHSRNIHKEGDIWRCNDGLLYFYHFSNYKPEKPNMLSGHQNRFCLKNIPGLHELFLTYTQLLRLNGYDSAKQWPYGYGNYSNGKTISESDRIVFRRTVPSGTLGNPFNLESYPSSLRIKIFKEKIWRVVRFLFRMMWRGRR